ncbi:Gasdermin-E [Channa argus]|uniref:Gasdermin-E n=1 Tax=Channa argus TaxID=215402 RepID=A0A6G1QHU5_CHAAH|nr:Gasdermin-E [Channa argus]
MFAARTKALVKNLGARGDLIYNKNVNDKIQMLTLVKVRKKKFWPVIKYYITDQTLLDLLEEADVSPEYTEEVLTEDFTNLRGRCGEGHTAAELDSNQAQLGWNVDTMDGASSFTLKKKTLDVGKLKNSCTEKTVKKKIVDMLKVTETDKLTFVYQTVYNTDRVDFFGKVEQAGSVSASFKKFLNLSVKESKEEKTRFTVPKESTFAYALMEITTDGGTLGIPPRIRKVNQYNKEWWKLSSDGEVDDFCLQLQQVKREFRKKEHLLQPLADLPESTSQDLRKHLRELLEDRDHLTLLEETWDQGSTGESDCPQSVSSFMELLKTSNTSTSQKDAVHLLISALDTLPDDLPELLTSCSPETLRVLNQLVDGLKGDGQTKLPESLPQGEELRWVVELLCSTNQMLEDLSDQWDRPEFPPGVMLEVLSLVVRGLSLMQPRTDS